MKPKIHVKALLLTICLVLMLIPLAAAWVQAAEVLAADAGELTTLTPTLPVNPFGDVQGSDWFIDSIIFVHDRGLMSGTDTDPMLFSPNQTLTRGMFLTTLWRHRGEPRLVDYHNRFTDVDWRLYYFDAVLWATAQRIVTGQSENTFGPDQAITRQDVAVILERYMRDREISLPVNDDWRIFADGDEVADYAIDAIQLLNKLDVIDGIGTNEAGQTLIDPKGNATRAQAAAMLHRFIIAIERA